MMRSAGCLVLTIILAMGASLARGQQAPATQPGVVRIQMGGGGIITIQGGGALQLNGVIIQPAQVPQPAAPNPYDKIEPQDRHFASDAPYPGSLDPLIERLKSTNFSERQQAMETLLRLSPDRLPEIQSALAQETSEEAVARLTQVAVHLYMKARTPLEGSKAMMGIMYNPELIRPDPHSDEQRVSIAVMELLPGYPAAQELRLGDRLIAVDGKPFPLGIPTVSDENGLAQASEEFKQLVSSYKPGGLVPFTVIRNGKQMEMSVQLVGVIGLDATDTRVQRESVITRYLAKLKTGLKETPLILKDDSAGASIFDENLQK